MRILHVFLLVALFVGILSSCRNKNYVYLEKLSIVEAKLDSVQDLINDIAINEFHEVNIIVKTDLEFIKNNYIVFGKIKGEDERYLKAYSNLGKRLSRYYKRGASTMDVDLQKRVSQLKNLKHDIKKNTIKDTALITKYIRVEMEAVSSFFIQINKLHANIKEGLKDYRALSQPVRGIVDREKRKLNIN